MKLIFFAQSVADVQRPLIYVNRRARRANKPRRSGLVGEVRSRDKLDKLCDYWVSCGKALGIAENETVKVESLTLPQTLVREEEERPVRDNGPAEIAAELVTLEWRRVVAIKLEEVAGVERIVTQEFKHFAMELVGPGARGDVDDRAGTLPEFWPEGRVHDFELQNGIDRRLEGDRAKGQVIERDPIDNVVDGFLTVSRGVERQ